MCNVATENLIEEVIDKKINQNEMFTAFDVSLSVKEEAKKRGIPTERHRDMKNAIHAQLDQFIQAGMYCRQLHNVGADVPAFLYFPSGAEPNQYVPQSRKDAPKPTQTNPVVDSPSVGFSSINPKDNNQSGGRQPDQRGTLTVPNHLLRAANFKPRDTVYVLSCDENGKPMLILKKQADQSAVAKYTVDRSSNVRITSATLAMAGMSGMYGSYDFQGDQDKVVVKEHV